MPRSQLRWVLLFALLVPAACAGGGQRRAEPAPAVVTPAEFIALVRAQTYARPLGGQAALTMTRPQKQSANIAFVVAPPESLRVDAQTLFGITLASFAADGARFGLFQYGENKYFMGAASSPAVRSLFLVPLSPREFVALVLGAPALDGYTMIEGSLTAGPAAFAANFAGAGGKIVTVVIDRADALVREVFYRHGGRTLHVKYESRRSTAAGMLPEKVRLEAGDELSAALTFGDWKFDVTPEADTFSLPPPPGAEVYLLGARPPQETP